jgi:hypothetical protein
VRFVKNLLSRCALYPSAKPFVRKISLEKGFRSYTLLFRRALMFRFNVYLLPFTLLLFVVGASSAQSTAAVAVRAVISYANLLTPEIIGELSTQYAADSDLALGFVGRHVADGVVQDEVAAPIRLALTEGPLPFEAFIIFIADLANGLEPAPSTLAEAIALLDALGIRYPQADPNGNISEETLDAALTGPSDADLASSQDGYSAPITPTIGD